jgi:hypothetical protein
MGHAAARMGHPVRVALGLPDWSDLLPDSSRGVVFATRCALLFGLDPATALFWRKIDDDDQREWQEA